MRCPAMAGGLSVSHRSVTGGLRGLRLWDGLGVDLRLFVHGHMVKAVEMGG